MANSIPLIEGTRLDDFVIVGVLKRSLFGYSYLATGPGRMPVVVCELFPHDYVLRDGDQMRPRNAEDRSSLRWWLRSFLDTAAALGKLRHRNLMRVFKHFEANGTGYYVYEQVPGEGLDAVLDREGTLSESQLRRILGSTLAALGLLHGAGLLHGDIEPGNLIIQPDGSPLLVDFNCVRVPIRLKARIISNIGTPPYAAPEETIPNAVRGPWSDLYSLGAIAYHALCGLPPVEAGRRTAGAVLASVADVARVRCSESLAAAVNQALQLDPELRPQDAAAWRAQLGAALEPETPIGVTALRPIPVQFELSETDARIDDAADGDKRKSPILLVGGIAAVVAVIAIAIVMATRHPATPTQTATVTATAPAVPRSSTTAVAAPVSESPPAAVAPAPSSSLAAPTAPPATSLDRIAADLIGKERKAQETRDQLQKLQQQREAAASLAAGKQARTAVGAAPLPAAAPVEKGPSEEEVAAERHARELEEQINELKQEKNKQEAALVADEAAAKARQEKEQSGNQAAITAAAEKVRIAGIVAKARKTCDLAAPDLSPGGNLIWETAGNVPGAQKMHDGSIRISDIPASDGSSQTILITKDSCAHVVRDDK